MRRFTANPFNVTCLITAALLGCVLGGCAKVSHFLESSAPFRTETYKDAFETWSREARIHRGLEVILIASSTFRSEEFRRAYSEEYSAAYRLTGEDKKRFLDEQIQGGGRYLEFVVATYVAEKKWDEFDKVRSIWKLYLMNEKNEQVSPVEIKKLKSGDPVSAHFYPYITPWKSIYTVRFPAFPGTDQPCHEQNKKLFLKMVITSVLGTTEMVWDSK